MKTVILPIQFKLLLLDGQTNEKLFGVRVETNNKTYYTNLQGEVSIPKDEKIKKISYISYSDVNNIKITNDTILTLKSF